MDILNDNIQNHKSLDNIMVKIPSGEILMRDDRKKETWNVRIDTFFLAQFPVTQSLYYRITQKKPSYFKGLQNPVENISWFDAVIFCNLLSQKEGLNECYSIIDENVVCYWITNGYRLPSEAEWLYACRTGTNKVRYGELDNIAWFKENSDSKTHEVGSKEPNAWGLFDMLGNVWEWCWDIYDEKVYGSYRVFRGGGWSDIDRCCLATNRRRGHPTFKIDDLGFRIAKSL